MTPPPATPPTENPLHAFVHGFLTEIADVASRHPWVPVVLGLIVASTLVSSARKAIHDGPRDPVRCFSRSDKALLLAWSGHRCEHHGLFGRCEATERLEADHIHPHSRGGWTRVSNGQILCRAHNRAKRANIPWDRSLRKMSERRAAYYPAGVHRAIVRRQPRQAKKASV